MTEQTDRLPVLRHTLLAAGRALAFDSRDWALDRTDAILYGLLCGWGAGDDGAWVELAGRFGWSPEYVHLLRLQRAAVAAFTGVDE